MSSIFGTIFSAHTLEKAVVDHFKLWSTTYLAELERQTARAKRALPEIRSYTNVNDFTKWPEDQVPCMVVVCPGMRDTPQAEGNGVFRARWVVGIAVVVEARSRQETNEMAKLYGAFVRAVMLQQPSLGLGDRSRGVHWREERYDDLQAETSRSLGAAQCIFDVNVGDVTSAKAGPLTPNPDPYGDFPESVTATKVIVEVKE